MYFTFDCWEYGSTKLVNESVDEEYDRNFIKEVKNTESVDILLLIL